MDGILAKYPINLLRLEFFIRGGRFQAIFERLVILRLTKQNSPIINIVKENVGEHFGIISEITSDKVKKKRIKLHFDIYRNEIYIFLYISVHRNHPKKLTSVIRIIASFTFPP